ncbi:phosphoadenosine phosphosulfate reductase [Olsenella sp. HMSC062G07]|uniref:phosphoadenosine phosphosulfate reductase n=1 Tax=Olsenella sp. HMSC062G07 TaxID=1739330 RepID=UPI0008A4879E|nr:phosphoadenosine phosphosulfate reductase [Olsenella sp. HMSC062G07]OFK25053.1 phosphoadenosine phosphosulfate reductase [Olsenella sp. HMSC062G07]
MRVAWFSAGASSFVAAYLSRPDRVVYIDVADQHPDSMRFVRDCEGALGREIEVIRSTEYSGVDDVIERRRYINGPGGAACTLLLKKRVRQEWERRNYPHQEGFEYVWGFDANERRRAERLDAVTLEARNLYPLIERWLTKEDCHAMLERLGIRRPAMYDLGYANNNCVGCVKGGMGYWNRIRGDFPDVFARRAREEREVGHSCIKGVFLDELSPERGDMKTEIMPECSLMCELAIKEDE